MGRSGRFELKYVLHEEEAKNVAEFVSHYLRPSEHNGSGPVPGHPVYSLYLDSPDLELFRQGIGGFKNRVKLRIRFYDNEWNRPAFLEIKRRVSDVIVKARAMISREGVREMLRGGWPYWPDHSRLVHSKRRIDVHDEFVHLCNNFRVDGMLFVSYVREIFESVEDEELRVTMDRRIYGTLYDGTGRLGVPKIGVRPWLPYFPRDGVVLELKFEDSAPRWMSEMVRRFSLERRSVCKYCACVDTIGLQWGVRKRPELEEQMLAVI
jgi:hypothetical protein